MSLKLKFTDSKSSKLIFRDYEYDEKGCPVFYTEEAYENLLNKSYRGKELSDFYELNNLLGDLLDEVYDEFNYPRNTDWFIDPEVLKDDSKMKKLYEEIRSRVLKGLNDGTLDYDYKVYPEDRDKLKDIFRIKYTFEDRKYLLDEPEFKPDTTSELEEEYNKLLEEQKDEENKDEGKLVNSTCKEFLEAYENKVDKKEPKWYLIQIALNKDKGWAYIKKPEDLQGNVEIDVVTPKTAKKIIKQGTQK